MAIRARLRRALVCPEGYDEPENPGPIYRGPLYAIAAGFAFWAVVAAFFGGLF